MHKLVILSHLIQLSTHLLHLDPGLLLGLQVILRLLQQCLEVTLLLLCSGTTCSLFFCPEKRRGEKGEGGREEKEGRMKIGGGKGEDEMGGGRRKEKGKGSGREGMGHGLVHNTCTHMYMCSRKSLTHSTLISWIHRERRAYLPGCHGRKLLLKASLDLLKVLNSLPGLSQLLLQFCYL